MGTLKTQSPHTPQHRAHTARGTLKTPSPHTPQYRDHTQGNFVENLKVSTHHSTRPTHRGTLKKLKVPTHHSSNTVERNMAHLLLSCSQIFFWNWSRTEKNIGVFKSMRLILCERKHLNIGFHPYPKLYAGFLFHDFRRNMSRTEWNRSRTEKSQIWKLAFCGP